MSANDLNAEKHLAQVEGRYRGLLDAVPDAMVVLNQSGEILLLNLQAEKQFGYDRDELVGQDVKKIIREGFANRLLADGPGSAASAPALHMGRGSEVIARRKDGSEFPIELMLSELESDEGIMFAAAVRDISVRKAAEKHLIERRHMEEALFVEKERAQVTLNSIGDAVACTDISGNITFLNKVAETMTGWSLQEAAGRSMTEVFRIRDDSSGETIPDPMAMAIKYDRTVHLPPNCTLVRRDGAEIPIEDSVAPIHNRDGRASGAVIVLRDVSAGRALTRQLTHSAQHDFLTGLPNRLLLNDRISQAIAMAARHKKKVAVMFLDLDGFKHINDSLGHQIGDKVLQSVAKLLLECMRESDTLSRQGGDEFITLLPDLEHRENAAITAEKLLQATTNALSIDQHRLRITASIGVSLYPEDGLDASTLIKNADIAMYQAKKNGRQKYQFFKPEMAVRAEERQSVEEDLRRALADNETT